MTKGNRLPWQIHRHQQTRQMNLCLPRALVLHLCRPKPTWTLCNRMPQCHRAYRRLRHRFQVWTPPCWTVITLNLHRGPPFHAGSAGSDSGCTLAPPSHRYRDAGLGLLRGDANKMRPWSTTSARLLGTARRHQLLRHQPHCLGCSQSQSPSPRMSWWCQWKLHPRPPQPWLSMERDAS